MNDKKRLSFIKNKLSSDDYLNWKYEYHFTNGSNSNAIGTVCSLEVDKHTGNINEVTIVVDSKGNVEDYSNNLGKAIVTKKLTKEIKPQADNFLLSLAK